MRSSAWHTNSTRFSVLAFNWSLLVKETWSKAAGVAAFNTQLLTTFFWPAGRDLRWADGYASMQRPRPGTPIRIYLA